MFGAEGMKEKNTLTTVGWLEDMHQEFGFIPDYIFTTAKTLERHHIRRAFLYGQHSYGKTFDEFYYEFYESKEAIENTNRLVEMFTYADRYGYSKALKKFTDENKSREDEV
jgi:hypothetical protein